ncbi:Na+/H+ antiporter subunit E [Streptantibioticus parmotrematis]|uniref:Na+/H+ antiporter subunit E n=1 Tax=Streptantibioticus parmotrematis TaxID=2873249 RepID=UPI0033E83E39
MARAGAAAVREVLAWWVALVVLYLMFISTISVLECVVGVAGAALVALVARQVRLAAGGRPGAKGRLGPALRAFPAAVCTDTGQLASAIARSLLRRPDEGAFHTLRLRDDAGPAWACALLSATPGAYVVDVRHESGERLIQVHTLGDPNRLERALTHGGRR